MAEHGAGIVIHLYTDIDAPTNTATRVFVARENPYSAEELCVEVAKKLRIGPKAFHCFALCTCDIKLWLPPNERIDCNSDTRKDYVFRMRFIPTEDCLFGLMDTDVCAYDYFYLQVRDDFVTGRVRYENVNGKKITQAHLLGLGVIDMLRWGKEHDMDIKQMQKSAPKTKKFIPNSEKDSFRFPWDMKRLTFNFNNHLEKVYAECENHSAQLIKRRYMKGFLNYVDEYCSEVFTLLDGRQVCINPHNVDYPGMFIVSPDGVSIVKIALLLLKLQI